MSSRPPYLVPPEQQCLWNKEDEENYIKWKASVPIDYKKGTGKVNYRQHVIDLNTEFDMEEVFDQLEIGLNAIEKLAHYIKAAPKYSLSDDLDSMYTSTEHLITKKFITMGAKFVEDFQTGLSPPSETNLDMKDNILTKELTTPVDKGGKEETEMESQETKIGKKLKKKKKKRSGQRRLLKFHQKLVKSCGLPPSKLMRSLSKDFEDIGVVEANHTDLVIGEVETQEVSEDKQKDGETGKGCQPETETGTSSRYKNQQLLCSSPWGLMNWLPYNPSQPVLNLPPYPPQPVLCMPYLPPPFQLRLYTPPPTPTPQPILYTAYCSHCNLWGNVYSNTLP